MERFSVGVRQLWHGGSVRLQLTAWYGAALIALLLVLGLLVYGLLLTNLQHEAERRLAAYAAQVAQNFSPDEEGANFQDTPAADQLTLIYGSGGALLESSSPGYRPPALPGWATGRPAGVYTTATIDGGRWLLYATVVAGDEHAAGDAILVVGQSLEPLYGMLSQVLWALGLAGPLVALLACAGGYFLAGRALSPVARLTRTARRIAAEGLGSRIGTTGRYDELGELAATFDAMLARLEDSFARERRFTADAAHELRTPLAVVQAETSLALARARPAGEYRRVLAVVEDESLRMGRLIGDLLVLARADEGRHRLARSPVDLTALCHRVTMRMAKPASAKGITLGSDLATGIEVVGDEAWLLQMLVNLVDNGIKYTQFGGLVRVSLTAGAGQAVVSVEDNGAGIGLEQLPHIFDRFYRADKARSRDSEASGFGLGLAICQWVAKAHDGRIEVSSQPGRGSLFRVYLPCEQAVAPGGEPGAPAARMPVAFRLHGQRLWKG